MGTVLRGGEVEAEVRCPSGTVWFQSLVHFLDTLVVYRATLSWGILKTVLTRTQTNIQALTTQLKAGENGATPGHEEEGEAESSEE